MFCCIILMKYIIYHVFSEMKAGSGKKAIGGDGAKRPESPHEHASCGVEGKMERAGKTDYFRISSISASSSTVNVEFLSRPFRTSMICAGRLAPTRAEETVF